MYVEVIVCNICVIFLDTVYCILWGSLLDDLIQLDVTENLITLHVFAFSLNIKLILVIK